MKKILKIIGIVFFIFIVIGVIGSITNPKSKKLDIQKSLQEGYKKGKETLKKEEVVVKKTAVLSWEDKTILQDITIWNKAGSVSSVPDVVANGNVPNNTKVDILGTTVAEGFTFYKIRSSVGKVDVLPTDLGARARAKEEKPKSEWTIDADPSFPVEGWVTADFVTNIKQ